jgi:hypothetical protein
MPRDAISSHVFLYTYIRILSRFFGIISLSRLCARVVILSKMFSIQFSTCVYLLLLLYTCSFSLSLSLSKTSLAFIHHRLYQRMHLRHVYYRPHHPHAHHRRSAQQMLQMVRAPYPRRVDVRRARAFQHAKRKRRSPKSHLFFSSSFLFCVCLLSLSSKIFYYTFSLSL